MYNCINPQVCGVGQHRDNTQCKGASAKLDNPNKRLDADSLQPKSAAKHTIRNSIDDVNRLSCEDRAYDFLDNTEMGDHFDPGSLKVKDDGTGFSLKVEESFEFDNQEANEGDTVEFSQWAHPERVIQE